MHWSPHMLASPFAIVLTLPPSLSSKSSTYIHVFIDSNGNYRDSLLATLESIHRAGILHGDIRLPNFCVTPSGEAFVLDFTHSTESFSQKEKAQETRDLSHILRVDSLTRPAAEVVEKSAAAEAVEKPAADGGEACCPGGGEACCPGSGEACYPGGGEACCPGGGEACRPGGGEAGS